MKKIAIDPGYGYVKGLSEYGNRVLFPSLVGSAHDRYLSNILGGNDENGLDNLHVIYTDNDTQSEFFVGELARESRNASYSFDQNKINHINTKVLIATAASLLAQEGEKIWVGVGLPLEYFKSQGAEMKRMLEGFKATIRFPDRNYERNIRFNRVSVFAQGATSVYDALLMPNGKERHPDLMRPGSIIALVNWGTRTVDVVVFKRERALKVQPELSFTLDDAGAMEIRRMVQQAFQQEAGAPISIVDAENIIENGGYTFYNGKEYNFSHAIETAKRHIVRHVLDSLQSRWGNKSGFIRKVFFAGGTVEDVRDVLKEHTLPHDTTIVDDPQFSEARGMLQLMRLQEKQEQVAQERHQAQVYNA